METIKLKPINEDKKDLVERFKVLRGQLLLEITHQPHQRVTLCSFAFYGKGTNPKTRWL